MAKSIPHKYGVIALSEEDKEQIRKAWANGSTHATYTNERWESLKKYVNDLDSLYQQLETTDDITEDNPAFDMMCKFTEEFYIALENVKSIVFDDGKFVYNWTDSIRKQLG